jgi:nitrile hydratase subunit alpha
VNSDIEGSTPDQTGYYKRLQAAVEELLILKGIVTREDIDREVAAMEARSYKRGAAVVARAWADDQYKKRLLADGPAAVRELGMDIGSVRLIVVENTPAQHNVVVCTLCSCYPRTLLGMPPDWYKSVEYRSRVVREPRAVLREFGVELPESVAIRVHDSSADMRYMVLPRRPPGTDGWPLDRLAALVTRDSLVGTGIPSVRSIAE